MTRAELIPNVTVPEGIAGSWRVERFEQTRAQETMSAFKDRGRYCPAGTYTRLMRDKTVVMSDTRAEKSDHMTAVLKAQGACLVNGLGLGMVVQAMLLKPGVTRVTVVEQSAEVIQLVAPHYLERFGADRFDIVHASAIAYTPPVGIRYGAVWHDIWDSICGDNLPEMHALHRKYGRRTLWQGSWGREEIEASRRRVGGWMW